MFNVVVHKFSKFDYTIDLDRIRTITMSTSPSWASWAHTYTVSGPYSIWTTYDPPCVKCVKY